MDGRLLSSDGLEDGLEGPSDGREETKSPPGSIRRLLTLPPELDLPVDNRDGPRRGSLLFHGLCHHRSDESDYQARDRLLEGYGAGGSGYTSLRDLLPSPSTPSPTAATAWPHDCEISIRNRLVKQAAYAYLQPMAAALSPGSARGQGLLPRLCWDADGCAGFFGARLIPAMRRVIGWVIARFRRKFGGRGVTAPVGGAAARPGK